MTPTVLYRIFKDILPVLSKSAKSYLRVDEQTISIHMEDGDVWLFTYRGPDNWDLCTSKFRKEK